MSPTLPDPAQWLTNLLKTGKSPLWPFGGGADMAKAMVSPANAAEPLTKALTTLTEWQTNVVRLMATPWIAVWPGLKELTQPKDRRFADEAWTKDPRYAALAGVYLKQTEEMRKSLDRAPVDARTKAQWSFALRQLTDALSPANNLATNPEAMKLAIETKGASLVEGMKLFAEDLAKGRIAMTDESAFEVGTNVCVTPGEVVFQNEVMQLIQYTPTTDEVHELPLLIVPPCINKYYILDLQPANSFVAHAVAEGHTVFLVSWKNATAAESELTWDDYVAKGVLRAIDVMRRIRSVPQVNTLGFCIGGALLASALAVSAAHDEHPAASMTLLTTMLDYSDTGELGLMVSEEALKTREQAIGTKGLLHGKELAQVFASLRANDLIWPYVVKGYLQGQAPPAFDLLYWNSDDTNLPGPMYCWYLRNMYLENRLREPGGTVQCGVPVDLGSVDLPTFVYASREDHIVPWKTAYTSTQLLPGDMTFVLGASGHIAGVINPPAKNKRNFWITPADAPLDADPVKWLDSAEKVPGSWWPTWTTWLAPKAGAKVAAPQAVGNDEFEPMEPAPGSYVKAKAT